MGLCRGVLACALSVPVMASAAAAPFTWSTAPGDCSFLAGGFGPGGGSGSEDPFPFFFSFGIGGGTNGAAAGGQAIFNASGVRFNFGTFQAMWYGNGASSYAIARGRLTFTPTVPNLSYSFGGFLTMLEEGVSSNLSTCAVELHPDYPHPPSLYTNNFAATGTCVLWTPGAPQLGAQTGDLVQGQQYVMNWEFKVIMTGDTDPTAKVAFKNKAGPYFEFRLYQRPCPGDLSGDGYVDDTDFVAFAAAYSIFDCADPAMPPGCPSDVNNDGFVDDADFVIFAQAYENLVCP